MLLRLFGIIGYLAAGITYYSFNFNGNVEALPYVLISLIFGGIAHILAEIRGQAQVSTVSMDEDAVKAMLKGIREFDGNTNDRRD